MSECEVKKVNMPKFPPPQLIVLTIEEAKEISFHLYKLATLYELQILELDPDKKLIKPLAKTYERLNDKICQAMKTKRIEQAEKGHE